MLSYKGSLEQKQMFMDRFAAHRAADEVIQGIGFEGGKGCFIGCTMNKYSHESFASEIGPVWLAHLADKIFEGLPKEAAAQFGTELLEAIPCGVDLEPVKFMLMIKRMNRLIELQEKNTYSAKTEVIAALQMIKNCAEAELGKNSCDLPAESAAWSAAESAARSAAWSAAWSAAESAAESAARSAAWSAAESAAWSAAESAWSAAESAAWSAAESAWSAAESARSAAESARSAAESAWSAAWSAARSAARSAAYKQERDDLLDILRNLK